MKTKKYVEYINGTHFTVLNDKYYLNSGTDGFPLKSIKGYTSLSREEAEKLVEMLDSSDHSVHSAWEEIFNRRNTL